TKALHGRQVLGVVSTLIFFCSGHWHADLQASATRAAEGAAILYRVSASPVMVFVQGLVHQRPWLLTPLTAPPRQARRPPLGHPVIAPNPKRSKPAATPDPLRRPRTVAPTPPAPTATTPAAP